jgi:hypothetical protein
MLKIIFVFFYQILFNLIDINQTNKQKNKVKFNDCFLFIFWFNSSNSWVNNIFSIPLSLIIT